MNGFSTTHDAQSKPTGPLPFGRSGFTLIETVISLSIMSILLLGLSGAVMIASHAIPTATTSGINDQTVVDAVNQFKSDLRRAKAIGYREGAAGNQFSLTLQTTGATGEYDVVQYQYLTASKSFTRQVKGETQEVMFSTVSTFVAKFTLEDSDASVLWLTFVADDTIQRIFELHIALPDKPEYS